MLPSTHAGYLSMLDYAALARENLFVGVVALAVVLTATYAIFRSVKARNKRRRRAACVRSGPSKIASGTNASVTGDAPSQVGIHNG
jgi:hypothetical protein